MTGELVNIILDSEFESLGKKGFKARATLIQTDTMDAEEKVGLMYWGNKNPDKRKDKMYVVHISKDLEWNGERQLTVTHASGTGKPTRFDILDDASIVEKLPDTQSKTKTQSSEDIKAEDQKFISNINNEISKKKEENESIVSPQEDNNIDNNTIGNIIPQEMKKKIARAPSENTLEQTKENFRIYHYIMDEEITDDDYHTYVSKSGVKKKYMVKTGIKKFSLGYNIADGELEIKWINPKEVQVKATVTMPNGRKSVDYASCNMSELRMSQTRHVLLTTAITRAKNRCIANLVGCGLVSSEEISE